MARARLTRVVEFRADHRYWREEWSPEENRARFGDAAGPVPHGHRFRCEVTVEGEVDPDTGMVLDLSSLDTLLEREVVDRYGGRALHDLRDFRDGPAVPSTENLARVIWSRLAPRLPAGELVRVRVAEDERLWSDYAGS